MWPFISKRHYSKQWRNTLQTYGSAKKLYAITYVAFYQLKQPQHILMQKRNKFHIWWECVCYIWWKYNTWIFCHRESHWLISTAAAPWTSMIHTQSSHHHYPQAPSQWQSDTVGEDCPTGYGNSQAACFELWVPQEPDIKVALLNKFHSPAPEEWIHFLALINTLVSSNMYVTLGGWQYKFVIL